jgi:hypothetical protein
MRIFSMKAIRRPWVTLMALLLSASGAAAQLPPPTIAAPTPQPNPSSSLVVPAPGETPVSPGLRSSPFSPGANLRGTNQVVNPPRSVFHSSAYHRHRHRRYVHNYPQ